ncbi:DUF2510 domain-containing protein [Agromyces humi]|uniref:DUF2510 domain-containing protein n=1 Tax=Agromyces humi TaxID=1766800 RepID=UPI00135C02DC|nr:DUF2510 domain-containing protein [Agromyces humi]
MDDTGVAPAGWYPDTEQEGLRWWDGSQWTEHRTPLPAAPAAQPPGGHIAPPLPAKKPLSFFAKFMIATPFIVIAIIAFQAWNGQRANDPDRNNNEFAAILACEDAVKQNLKAPATADFESSARGRSPWIVTGYVDADNAFGALVRSQYTCEVKISGGTAHTTITSLIG